MKPQEILEALLEGKEVKLTEGGFTREFGKQKIENKFTVFQIEQSAVNLYNEGKEEVYHDISFDDIVLY